VLGDRERSPVEAVIWAMRAGVMMEQYLLIACGLFNKGKASWMIRGTTERWGGEGAKTGGLEVPGGLLIATVWGFEEEG